MPYIPNEVFIVKSRGVWPSQFSMAIFYVKNPNQPAVFLICKR